MKNMLKFADLKIPSEFAIFMKNGKNKTARLNLTGKDNSLKDKCHF